MDFLRLIRPWQWLKNLMIFFPPFLGGVLLDGTVAAKGVIPFIAFCFVSSGCYVVNDISDRDRDAQHPNKKNRPIASGNISLRAAYFCAFAFISFAILLSLARMPSILKYIIVYLAISICYSAWLKHVPILDIFCISAGFLVRLFAGGESFDLIISEWLFLSVLLLSLFLSIGKRLNEKMSLGKNASGHRLTLAAYPDGYLDGMMFMTGGAVLVTYTMYTLTRHYLIFTVPLCCYGLFRFIYRVKSGLGGDPTESLLRDRHLLIVGIAWVILVVWDIYI